MLKFFSFTILWFAFYAPYAQEAVSERPSPVNIARARYKDSYIKITYSQPHKNGREIFGKLVPYGQVWRTGANESTEITISRNVIINNQVLKAGTYTLFTIPDKEKWTIIINSDFGLWGAYNYNQKRDIIRFDVPVHTLNNIVYEPFTIQIDQKNELADILIFWDRVKVIVPLKFI
jgi:hypothetical protein